MKVSKRIVTLGILLVISFTSISVFAAKTAVATFAGGCFWSMQHDFDKLSGVVKTTVGYTGGTVVNPTYAEVSEGDTGDYEAIEIVYDPSVISYQKLVDFYWHDIDPTDAYGQFCDHGNEYHSVIFYHNDAQEKIAMQSKDALIQSKQFDQVATLIEPAQTFYPAEEYHQKYAEKNPVAYENYRIGCGRDARSKELWGSLANQQ